MTGLGPQLAGGTGLEGGLSGGGSGVDAAAPFIISDNFNRASLGADWSNPSGQWSISGNRAVSFGDGVLLHTTPLPTAAVGVYVQFLWYSGDTRLRLFTSGTTFNSGYTAGWFGNSTTGEYRIAKNGSMLGAAILNGATPSRPKLLRLEWESGTLRLYVDAALIATRVDSTSPLANDGVHGINIDHQFGWNGDIDDYEAGVLS